MQGRVIKLSAPRRLVGDLMRFSKSVPRVAVQRQMNLSTLKHARLEGDRLVSWTAIFLRGYALLARETPELRRAYIKLPWPHLYEYPFSVASIAHERDYNGERAVLLSLIKAPEKRSIRALQDTIAETRSRNILEVKDFRQALKFANLPAPVRWLLMWLALNIGRQRANRFGTFQLSVYSGLGAESLNPLTPLTTLINYGPISEDGTVSVRIHYDHRVMDGADVARALQKFETILNETMTEELRQAAEDLPSARAQ
jgi:hypothetical protein